MLVQASNRQAAELERFERENEGIIEAELASTRIRGLFTPLVDLVELLGVMVVIVLGTVAVTSGDLTIGGLLVFMVYLSQLYRPIRGLSSLLNSFYSASAGAERIIEFLDETPAVKDTSWARPTFARPARRHLRVLRLNPNKPEINC
jgi:ATP-binding cassette, subfamily B, bacterial